MKALSILTAAAVLFLSACGGGGSEDAASDPAGGSEPSTEVSVPTMIGSSDLEQVCAGGTIASAPAYDPSSKGPHPVIAFAGEDGDLEELTLDFPEGWAVEFLAYETAELVACLDVAGEKFVEKCEGYKSDESDEEFAVELYDMTYDVTLYAANSGEELVSDTIEASDKECPMIAFFDDGEESQRQEADPSQPLRDLVKPYVIP